MNNRLQQFLAAENISQSQFADTINVARASVSHILAGRNKPGWDFLNNMMRHYPNLNIEWLLNGTGKMYKTQLRQEEFKQDVKPAEEIPADLFTPQENPAPETHRCPYLRRILKPQRGKTPLLTWRNILILRRKSRKSSYFMMIILSLKSSNLLSLRP